MSITRVLTTPSVSTLSSRRPANGLRTRTCARSPERNFRPAGSRGLSAAGSTARAAAAPSGPARRRPVVPEQRPAEGDQPPVRRRGGQDDQFQPLGVLPADVVVPRAVVG